MLNFHLVTRKLRIHENNSHEILKSQYVTPKRREIEEEPRLQKVQLPYQ